jgi:uncharacterized RDD family membrane protein YckC
VKSVNEAKCAQCGTSATAGAKFCENCGASLAMPVAQRPAQPPRYRAPAYYTGAPTPYQGVAIRFVALIIDYVIICVIAAMLALPFIFAAVVTEIRGNASALSGGSIAAASLMALVVWFLYFTLLEGRYGQTIGKMALNIKVVRAADGAPIDFGEAAVRTILRIIDGLFGYLIGAIFIWTSDEKQRLGDRFAHTVVASK